MLRNVSYAFLFEIYTAKREAGYQGGTCVLEMCSLLYFDAVRNSYLAVVAFVDMNYMLLLLICLTQRGMISFRCVQLKIKPPKST